MQRYVIVSKLANKKGEKRVASPPQELKASRVWKKGRARFNDTIPPLKKTPPPWWI